MINLFDIYVDITDSICVKGRTQYISKDGRMLLSARYMLEGKDIEGKDCRCFIENSGSFDEGFIPKIVTDSLALSEFEDAELKAEIRTKENGVIVSIILP